MDQPTANGRKILITSGGAAFVLALAAAIVGWGDSIRGPQIEVGAPKGVFLYREGEAESSAIALAVRIPITNRSGYNDFVREASLSFSGEDAHFENNARVRLDFTERDDSSSLCLPQTRCLALKRMAITDVQDEMVEIPARGFRSNYYSFRLVCGQGEHCSRYGDSNRTIQSLSGRQLDITVLLQFIEDGRREVRCRTGPIDVRYIHGVGWQGLRCVETSVAGSSRYSLF